MNQKRPTVWVLKEQVTRGSTGPVPMDYSPAYKYGDIQFITDFDIPLTRAPSTLAMKWAEQAARFWNRVDLDNDYLILTGAPLSMFILGVLCSLRGAPPRILVWRREQGAYVVFDPVEVIVAEPVAPV